MAHALFDQAANGRHHALSAGSVADPDGRVHPEVVEVMREIARSEHDVPPSEMHRGLPPISLDPRRFRH